MALNRREIAQEIYEHSIDDEDESTTEYTAADSANDMDDISFSRYLS